MQKRTMEKDQSEYIQELEFKIIELEQEVDRLKILNNNQARHIKANLKSYGQQKYEPFFPDIKGSDGYEFQRIYDPYTKKERILVKSSPFSHQSYVSNNTTST